MTSRNFARCSRAASVVWLLNQLPVLEAAPIKLSRRTRLIGESKAVHPAFLLGAPPAVPDEFENAGLRLGVHMLSDSIPVANGLLDSRFTVQDRDSTTVTIPVSFTYTGIGEAGRQLLQMGAVNYRVLGDVTVGSVVGNFTIPYSSTGRFTTTGVTR